MNYEATSIYLDRLAGQIHRTHLEMLGKPTPALHSAEFQTLMTKSEGWKRQIENMSGAINSKYGLVQVSYGSMKRLDWNRKQSLRSQMRNKDSLVAKLKKIDQMVLDMCGDIIRGDVTLQALKTALESISDWLTDTEITGTQVKAADPITQFNQKDFAGHQAFPLVSFLIAFIALYVAIKGRLE